jgi:SAM-dependent methyltransferase
VGDSWIRKLAEWGRRAKDRPRERKTPHAATGDSISHPDRGGAKKTVLHVGCGRTPLDRSFPKAQWREIRLDINAAVGPDVVATITDLKPIPSASVDAVWSSHNIEHLFAHEVSRALEEFLRVLRPSGFVLITLPDVQEVARHVAEGNLERPLYESRAGPISAIDVLFGDRKSIARGEVAMAHKTGFTAASLRRRLEEAGFRDVGVRADRERLALWAKGHKP